MARIKYKKKPLLIASAALVALLGAGAASLTLEATARHEGYVPQAYLDPVGVWTKCFGDTQDVTPGAVYSDAECLRSLNDAVERHTKPVLACVPGLAGQADEVKAAFVSMAYNIGVSAFCGSSVADYARAGDWSAACKRIAQIYRRAGGRELPGLVKRRADESALCLRGLSRQGGGV